MVSPTRKRDAIALLQAQYAATTRRACLLIGQNRSTQLYKARRKDSLAVRHRMREIAESRPRYGYRRVHTLLRREGWKDSLNRVHRLYKLEGLHVRMTAEKKRRAVVRVPLATATAPLFRAAKAAPVIAMLVIVGTPPTGFGRPLAFPDTAEL